MTKFMRLHKVKLHNIKSKVWPNSHEKIKCYSQTESPREGYSASVLLLSQSAPIVKEKNKKETLLKELMKYILGCTFSSHGEATLGY